MFDERMIGVPNKTNKPNVEISLPLGWTHFDDITERQVDVGAPVLVYVTILSEHEARQRNQLFRERAEASMKKRIEEHGPDDYLLHMDRSALKGADSVDELLDSIKQEGYFASWVIVERCTID